MAGFSWGDRTGNAPAPAPAPEPVKAEKKPEVKKPEDKKPTPKAPETVEKKDEE